jgi:hypothetical protein
MGSLTGNANNKDYAAGDLARDLKNDSVAITDEDDLVDAFKILNGYAKAKDAAKEANAKGDPGKDIEDQAKATALAIFKFVEGLIATATGGGGG